MSQVRPTEMQSKPVRVPRKRKGLRRASKERAVELRSYAQLKEWWLKLHPICEVGLCLKPSVEPHHKAGRAGWKLCDVSQWLAVCRDCHNLIENNKKWARNEGYITYL